MEAEPATPEEPTGRRQQEAPAPAEVTEPAAATAEADESAPATPGKAEEQGREAAESAPADRPYAAPPAPAAVVFRVPTTALLAVALLALCMSPVGLASPALLVIFVVPVALAVWLLRTRTRADAEGLTVRTLFGRRLIPWSRVTSLRLTEKSAVRAVVDGDGEVTLPAVRVRHLPLLAAVSGGRIADPRQPHPGE
ncbi:PH domain-containing protein [Gandjariella thermophila]|uniref:Low molecular weight protein antigen 6 PH domain-containing protein n=1 Tax=Gandjariella thermophila TaxID=1931992 RepID=A0A4D4JBM8_9PSEU|nr:PH domain-containing protein [Gandjariella thermophila]GDY31846.1 hypothetical protein GTS_34790 [Gandjariella thermophila]